MPATRVAAVPGSAVVAGHLFHYLHDEEVEAMTELTNVTLGMRLAVVSEGPA